MERSEIRKRIQESGMHVFEGIEDRTLQNLVGEIMALNEEYVLQCCETNKACDILQSGFSTNQLKWIIGIELKLKEVTSRNSSQP